MTNQIRVLGRKVMDIDPRLTKSDEASRAVKETTETCVVRGQEEFG